MSEHIRTRQAAGTWVVRAGGAVIGETQNAVELTEGDHAPVIYFPRGDIAMAFLEPSATRTTCPHKGEASHYAIQTKSTVIEDAAWSYETPKAGLEAIAGHLAFYPDKVTVEQL
jgi:uncharacterized protein (DUF427 family)